MGHVDKPLIWETLGINATTGDLRAAMVKNDMSRRRELILVVDNDPYVKDVTGEILERYGHRVVTAGSRGEALAFCEQRGKELSLVLLDVVAMGQDASGVIQRFLESNPAVKIIVTSVYSNGLGSSDLLRWGASAFLKKPYGISELLRAVEQVQRMH
jgi:DNA-binding NtrC family response regulator